MRYQGSDRNKQKNYFAGGLRSKSGEPVIERKGNDYGKGNYV